MFSEYISKSPDETERISEKFAEDLLPDTVIAFIGGLGAGKTCFMRGLARGLGYTGDVTSPTFSIVIEYRGGRLPIFHFDMYRISSFDDLYSTGYFDYFDENGIIAVEWSENIVNALPEKYIKITIEKLGNENDRRIIIDGAENEDFGD